MRFFQGFLVVGLALAFALSSREARGLEPAFSEGRVTAGGGLRIGGNGLNFGLGGDVGYTIEATPVYIGGLADYWFGDHEEQSLLGTTITADSHGWNVLGVVGYDLGATDTIVIRPFGGAGIFHADAEVCTEMPGVAEDCMSASDSEAAGVFGGRALFLIGTTLHLGAEFRVLFATETAGILAGNIGAVF